MACLQASPGAFAVTTYTRTRTKGAIVSGGTCQFYTENCTTYPLNGQFSFGVGDQITMTDAVVKGFAKRRQRGEVFFNSMTKAQLQLSNGGGQAENQSVTNSCSPVKKLRHRWAGPLMLNFIPLTAVSGLNIPIQTPQISESLIQSMGTEASTAMLNSRGRADSNLFETLAEADQTLDLFNRPLSRLRRVLSEAAQAKSFGRFAGRAANGASNLWLAYRYAIRPIMSDINGIAEGLKEKTEKRRQTTRAKVTQALKNASVTNYPSHVTYHIKRETSDEVTCRAMSLDEVTHSLLENVGFTFKGLVTLPWELVHASFVADWFANVGDTIGAFVPSPGWNQLGSCLTITRDVNTTWTVVGSTSSASYTVVSSATGSYTRRDLTKTRSPVYAPSLVIKSDFKFDKATRVADALALASQQILRIFR